MAQLRALVVDDSDAMRRNLIAALRRMGRFSIDEAQDGVDALKLLAQTTYDLVLTDINMPRMDGLKLVNHIRQSAANGSVPIVVITTENAQEDRQRAMTLGATAYLVKPVQAKDVVQTVSDLLGLQPAAAE